MASASSNQTNAKFVFSLVAIGAVVAGIVISLEGIRRGPPPRSHPPEGSAWLTEDSLGAVLKRRPELIVDALDAFEAREKARAAKNDGDRVEDLREQLLGDPDSPATGPGREAARATVVEFFDYQCRYCRKAFKAMAPFLSARPDIRHVHKHFPIVSHDSLHAARVSLAVSRIDAKILPRLHERFMAADALTTSAVDDILRTLGLDPTDVNTAARAQWIDGQIAAVRALTRDLAIRGTPAFAVFGPDGAATLVRGAGTAAVQAALTGASPKAGSR